MSAATQTALGDPTRATPAFSYAQAAKGRSPSGPPSVSMEKAPKGEQDTRSVNPSTADNQDTALAAGSFSTKRAASEGHRSRNSSTTVTAETIPPFQGNTESSTTEPATTPATQASEQSQVAVSTPSSPEFGITSTSTIPKDDDLFSNANASSDSTWEKLSQGSQNGSKSNEKIDTEKEPTVSGSWDADTPALPVPPALKEAPPPTVNIWKQRIDAKAAKQPASTSSSNPSSQMTATDNVNRASKPFDIGAESRKHDNKKQVKRAQGGNDDKPATAGAKDAMKPMDGKGNAAEASEPGQPKHLRAANVDRSVPGSIAPPPPPPAGDAQSWPTPDSAVDEERRKAQERAEKGDKDKSTMTKSHGKEKWMPVPYVPSYVPSTPLPNIRRGARAPRGGRDSLPRGGGFSTDKATAGSPEATAGSQPVVSERGKPDSATTRSSSGTMRPKRASSAGPPATRDQRRGSDMTAPERRKDIGKSNMPAESRRASSITQDEEPRSRRGPTDPNEVDSQSGAAKVSQEPSGIPSRNDGAGDSHAHPKVNGFERRGEGGPRTYEYARDYHNVAPARERGEGRPERGRGGYRSRGAGNHTFTHAAIPNSHIGQHPYAPPPMPGKSSSFHDRHASQYQNSTYQPRQTQGRFRSGSQSYSVPHTATNTRFPQGQHTHQLPNLQTDVANAWGFQPGSQGIMSANPYNPYMEQVSIVGMVSMQM